MLAPVQEGLVIYSSMKTFVQLDQLGLNSNTRIQAESLIQELLDETQNTQTNLSARRLQFKRLHWK